MELHRVHKNFHPSHLGEEKQQMLNLNQRLETYLRHVKLLEEENEMLAKEITVLRHNSQGTVTQRRRLEEELRQARLEVDATWRERGLTEVEVGKLTEEIHVLELQRQREAEAKMLAKKKTEQSRKELENEQRAQIWLREKVNQLEHEMRFLIQGHEEDMAHLEGTLTASRAETLPNLIQRSKQTPDLLKMGHEFSQRATRAWQEATEAYQGQLAQLEESLGQAKSRLSQVCQEKHESQLKLQALQGEISSAQDVRLTLEKTLAQRREEHFQEIHQLGEHLEELEVEKEELGQQIHHLLQENHSLMQLKMSLGLEVSTYRALMDNESLGRDAVLLKKPRNLYVRDSILSPYGVKQNYPTQLSAGLKTIYHSSVQGRKGSTTATKEILSSTSAALKETTTISSKLAEAAEIKSETLNSPYPKIVQNGAAENFRPEEVHEKVTYAEPLSPPNEQEAPEKTSKVEDETLAEAAFESVVSHTAEFGLSREPPVNEKHGTHQNIRLSPVSSDVRMTEIPCHFSDELVKDVAFDGETNQEIVQHPRVQTDALTNAEHVQDDTSDSETEVMLEPTFESRPSSPELESKPLESVFIRAADTEESIMKVDAVIKRQESSSSTVEANGREEEDKLYPDGEEMDTWDSVIEKKVSERIDDAIKNEGNKQHAEPEEDISAKELEEEIKMAIQLGNLACVPQHVDVGKPIPLKEEHVPSPDKEDEGDEEDSQNVSVSWRTELESDSYAQENTIADTHPLIRYKSDDTDANTQASHFDESESSEGEEEKKFGEAGAGTWSDGKPKTFGTMEDLHEEVEDETVDDDDNLKYSHVEYRNTDQGKKASEYGVLVNDAGKVEKVVKSSIEGHSDDGATICSRADEELETDKLVEKELENLSTDSFSAVFANRQVKEDIIEMEQKSIKEMDEQEPRDETSEPEESLNYGYALCITHADETLEKLPFGNLSVKTRLTEEAVEQQNKTEKSATDICSEHEINVNSEFEHFVRFTEVASEKKNFCDPFAEMPPKNALTEELEYEHREIEKAIEVTNSCDLDISFNHGQISSTAVRIEVLERQDFSKAYPEMHLTHTLTKEVVNENKEMKKVIEATDIYGPKVSVNNQHGSSTVVIHESLDNQCVSEGYAEIHSTNTLTEEVVNEQKEFEKATEDTDSCEPEMIVNNEQVLSNIVKDGSLERQCFSEANVEVQSTKILTEEYILQYDQQTIDNPETKEEEHEHNIMSDVGEAEHQSGLKDYISRFDMEDVNNIHNPSSVLQVKADSKPFLNDFEDPTEIAEVPPGETPYVSKTNQIEDDEGFHRFSEEGETTELESTEDTTNICEMSDQNKHDLKNDNIPKSSDDDIIIHQEEPVEIPCESSVNKNNIFLVEEKKDSSLHSPFTSDRKNDFWVSSFETGATHTPGDALNESAEQTNHDQGFADNIEWRNLENPEVVNGNSKLKINPSGLDTTNGKEQIKTEVKKVVCRNVVEAEMVHSEESDAEAESWSSGEEPV